MGTYPSPQNTSVEVFKPLLIDFPKNVVFQIPNRILFMYIFYSTKINFIFIYSTVNLKAYCVFLARLVEISHKLELFALDRHP